MRYTVIMTLLMVLSTQFSQAQFVTIPDDNFVYWLELNYPECMDGNQMDTTCTSIEEAVFMSCYAQDIESFEGLQHFESLGNMDISNNLITSLDYLPPGLWTLIISNNPNLSSIPPLPDGLTSYFGSFCPNLPVPEFPEGLQDCDLQSNGLTEFPEVPDGLQLLILGNNPIGDGMPIPPELNTLGIDNCNLTELPVLPATLAYLSCSLNNISDLGVLPEDLETLHCSHNPNLTTLPLLADEMVNLTATNCALTSMTNMPVNCGIVNLNDNQLTQLPGLPTDVEIFKANNNNLTDIPPLPESLVIFEIMSNNVFCLPYFPPTIFSVELEDNPFTCLPNYISCMSFEPYLDDIPLCEPNDLVNNPLGCEGAHGIEGDVFNDDYANCLFDADEEGLENIVVRLYDESMTLLGTTSTGSGSRYHFPQEIGTYIVEVDTAGKPFIPACEYPGADSTVVLTEMDSLISQVDFPFQCKEEIDLGVLSTFTSGWVFPGQEHRLSVRAGDISSFYNLNCAAGIAGTISFTIDGPVELLEVVPGNFEAIVDGLTFTYNIDDFGQVQMNTDFRVDLLVDTDAQAGDLICVNVDVSLDSSDYNTENNQLENCYEVVNSYDPNNKLVYPARVEPLYNDWLHYTINFQNTGNAPAFNIRLEDELSDLLDLETFQVTGYSHDYSFDLIGNDLTVYYPNIMLADSLTNEPESKGYFQYRIKPLSGLPLGTEIENTAGIFFDYNDPIITNTAVTTYETDISIFDESTSTGIRVYPNPNQGSFSVSLKPDFQLLDLEVLDLLGRPVDIVWSNTGNRVEVMLNDLAAGQYVVRVECVDAWFTQSILVK